MDQNAEAMRLGIQFKNPTSVFLTDGNGSNPSLILYFTLYIIGNQQPPDILPVYELGIKVRLGFGNYRLSVDLFV